MYRALYSSVFGQEEEITSFKKSMTFLENFDRVNQIIDGYSTDDDIQTLRT